MGIRPSARPQWLRSDWRPNSSAIGPADIMGGSTPGGVWPGRRIGIVSLGMDRSLLALPVIASAISGAEAALTEAGATVQLAQVPNLEEPPRAVRVKHLDGLILFGGSATRLGGPITQHVDGAAAAIALGVGRGPAAGLLGRCRNLQRLCHGGHGRRVPRGSGSSARSPSSNPKPDHLLFLRREDGFTATARRLGAAAQTFAAADASIWQLPLQAPQSVETVQELVDRLIAAQPRPTALFAAADSVAALVYRACGVRTCASARISASSRETTTRP